MLVICCLFVTAMYDLDRAEVNCRLGIFLEPYSFLAFFLFSACWFLTSFPEFLMSLDESFTHFFLPLAHFLMTVSRTSFSHTRCGKIKILMNKRTKAWKQQARFIIVNRDRYHTNTQHHYKLIFCLCLVTNKQQITSTLAFHYLIIPQPIYLTHFFFFF